MGICVIDGFTAAKEKRMYQLTLIGWELAHRLVQTSMIILDQPDGLYVALGLLCKQHTCRRQRYALVERGGWRYQQRYILV